MLAERHGHVMATLIALHAEVRTLADRQLVQNGRVGNLEVKVAVIEDRNPNRATAAISAGVAAAIAAASAWFSQ
jgi:hypothetical protein